MQNSLVIIGVIAGFLVLLLLVLRFAFKLDMYFLGIIALFGLALAVCAVVIRMQNDRYDARKAEKNLNRAIALQNQVKIKYVNIANALDYACEKYHVRSSAELGEMWEYYMEMVKEREKYQKTGEDLEYYGYRLMRMLDGFRLNDTQIWVSRASALLDEKEMEIIKKELIAQRQKLRDHMKFNMVTIRRLEKEAESAAAKVKTGNMGPQIQDILKSIHKLSRVV